MSNEDWKHRILLYAGKPPDIKRSQWVTLQILSRMRSGSETGSRTSYAMQVLTGVSIEFGLDLDDDMDYATACSFLMTFLSWVEKRERGDEPHN
jgi:hypothetical protein